MNDEIKEILKDLEYASGVFDYTITPDKCALLLNYINNLQQRIYKARKMIFDNYGLLDKYGIELLEDILKGDSNE